MKMLHKLKSFLPFIKAQEPAQESNEEDFVDPMDELREKCDEEESCQDLFWKYQQCNDRVNSRDKTTETCEEELFDYLHERDHCVAHSLWSKLK